MYKIPTITNKTTTILAKDNYNDLIMAYNRVRKTAYGKYISETSLIYKKLQNWITVERAELIIPYAFTTKKNEPIGYRIWYLSQFKDSQYYNGQFFDLQISGNKRKIRQQCKLSEEAIKFFNLYPQIKESKPI